MQRSEKGRWPVSSSRGTPASPERRAPAPIRRLAVNSAAESDNKIHSDAEAQRFGYRAALVPGVTLYAYLTQFVVPFFGADWLARGSATLRLLRPAYEGETVVCNAALRNEEGRTILDLTCAREDGTVCADGSAWLHDGDDDGLADAPPLPETVPPEPLPALTPATVPLGVPLAPIDTVVSAEQARAYADETADPSRWWRLDSPFGGPLLPPGMLAGRQARLLRANFSFGPSIHTASEIRHLAPAPAGARYRTGGVIKEAFERKDNHYLVLDALTTADGRPVVRVRHTSIFQVRGS